MQVALSRVHVNKETLFLNGRAFSPLSLLPSFCLSPAEERRKRRGARRSPSVTGAQCGGISVVHERETARGSSVDLRRGRRRVLPPSPSVALPTTTPPRPSRQRPRGGEVAEAGRRLSLPPSSPSRSSVVLMSRGPRGLWGGGSGGRLRRRARRRRTPKRAATTSRLARQQMPPRTQPPRAPPPTWQRAHGGGLAGGRSSPSPLRRPWQPLPSPLRHPHQPLPYLIQHRRKSGRRATKREATAARPCPSPPSIY